MDKIIKIRNEEAADYQKVEEITRKSFWNLYIPGCNEHYLVHVVRSHEDFLPELDLVLVMTVEPGFGGQKLNADMLDKIRALRALGYQGEIEVDGGITPENAPLLAQAGADTLVMGTSFFRANDPAEKKKKIHSLHA